jgi:WD40 repeat protein
MRAQDLTLVSIPWIVVVLATCVDSPSAKGRESADAIQVEIPKPVQNEDHAEVLLLAYSPKLKMLACTPGYYNFASTPEYPVFVWDLKTGTRRRVLSNGRRQEHLAFTADGDGLIASGRDGVTVWNPVLGTADRQRFKDVKPLATISPEGKLLVHLDDDGNIVTWSELTGDKKRILQAPQNAMEGLLIIGLNCAIDFDQRWIALGAGLSNHRIVIWDYKKGAIVASLLHESRLFYLSFLSTGQYLCGGGNEVRKVRLGRGVLDVWDTHTWKFIREIEVDSERVIPILDLPQQDMVLTVENLRTPEGRNTAKTLVNGYSIKTGARMVSFDTQLAKNGWCTAALFLPDMNAICIGGNDGKVSFFSVQEILKHKTKD